MSKTGPNFALATALRALGLPCQLRREAAHLACLIEKAARELDAALRATNGRRVHLAPLDLGGDIPRLQFGSARVCRFKPEELRAQIEENRLKRMLQHPEFDAERFSEFHWLVVEEIVTFDKETRSLRRALYRPCSGPAAGLRTDRAA